ncbi:sodium:solute symporter [Chitinophaga horti]|uniref:Sodium:solute symporter n=1 Tax=Chitinophaga horti TaxID=2920382 RepID=A0ABY6J5W1_9BACT|nr:sodium:solute symporter [Chitinophaga horti]UYQ93564.1 sodium:solute symporter [Chitinophaga horti]
MAPVVFLACIAAYFLVLLLVSYITTRKYDAQSYFTGNRNSVWYLVAIGLISDTLSGVSFISVPGKVGLAQFSYLQTILGYIVGYFIIAAVLVPLFYKRGLTSIYSYLDERFGPVTQKIGAAFFILSRLTGSAARLFVVAGVLQRFVFSHYHIPFTVSVTVMVALMLVYTYRGGIKTLVWTDALQSFFLLSSVVIITVMVARELDWTLLSFPAKLADSPYSQVFFWDNWKAPNFFPKDFFGGMMIAVAMTGLDQNMMQKNLSCRTLGDAKKNIYTFSLVQALVNGAFVMLGGLFYAYINSRGIALPTDPVSGRLLTDSLFPSIALDGIGGLAAIAFIVGLTAAAFSSADGVLTTLTTSFYIDILGRSTEKMLPEQQRVKNRIHIGMAAALLATILLFQAYNNSALIDTVLFLAAITYGPMLGLFAFGILHRQKIWDNGSVIICLVAPALCFILSKNAQNWLAGYKFGNELLILNGMFTYIGLWLISAKSHQTFTK